MRRGEIGRVSAAAALAILVGGAAAAADFQSRFSVELERYLGVWHEAARAPNPFQDDAPRENGQTFSPCLTTVTTYERRDADSITVRNVCTRRSASGETLVETAKGVGDILDDPEGRKLELAFGGGFLRGMQRLLGGFDYWIYCLGPENDAGRYAWTVVGDPPGEFLYILTREAEPSEAVIDAALSCARAEGRPVRKLEFTEARRP